MKNFGVKINTMMKPTTIQNPTSENRSSTHIIPTHPHPQKKEKHVKEKIICTMRKIYIEARKITGMILLKALLQ